jgi:hypothetical protein
MEDRFELLTCNDDVISLQEHTFRIGEFREKLSAEFHFREDSNGEISHFGYRSINGMPIPLDEINWKSSIIDCEVLRLGSQRWQKGKCRLQVNIKNSRNERERKKQVLIEVDLEFCPDELPISEPESPLDDLRQMIHQETQQ